MTSDPPLDDEALLQGLIEDRLEELSEEIDDEDELSEAVSEFFDDLVDANYDGLMDHMDNTLEDRRETIDGFRDRLYDTWKEPIDLFEAYTLFCQEIGQMYSHDRREAAMADEDLVQLALVKLHGRACLLSREILTLIKNGFADAAHARWRSIHEVAVVAEFIRQSGQETAKRFLLHKTIDDYYHASAIRDHQDDLDVEPITDEDFEEIKSLREKLLDQFGQSYDGTWGWAAHELDSGRFRELQEKAGLEQHRPYYVYASKANIHSGAMGTFDQLNTVRNGPVQGTVAGPSNYGFTLPATHTARALSLCTTSLIMHRPNEEYIVQMLTSDKFLRDIEKAFPKVRAEIQERDEEMWDEYLEERLAEIEENLDEFMEDLEDFTPPFVEIDTDNFDVHVGGKGSQDEDS